MNGESPLSAGENTATFGATLTITATPADNYRLESLNINGQPIQWDIYCKRKMQLLLFHLSKSLCIKQQLPSTKVDYQITAGEEVIENLESIASGTELTITIFNSLPENKKIESVLGINEQPAEAEENGSYIFTVTENTTIIVNLTDITYYTVTLPTLVENGQLSVMNGSEPLTTGERILVKEGTVLTITATADPVAKFSPPSKRIRFHQRR